MVKRTIVEFGSIEFTHRKQKYVVQYSVTNDGFVLPHYENVGGCHTPNIDSFITVHGDLDSKVKKVLDKKLPNLKQIPTELYFSSLERGTLPTSQFNEGEEVLKSSDPELKVPKNDSPVREPKELVTKTPGYKRRTQNPAMGRPAIGTTRKVSLTLHDDVWALIDAKVAMGEKASAVIRELIEGRAI